MKILAAIGVILSINVIVLSVELAKTKKKLDSARRELLRISNRANMLARDVRNLPNRLYDKDGNEYLKLEGEFGEAVYSKISTPSAQKDE